MVPLNSPRFWSFSFCFLIFPFLKRFIPSLHLSPSIFLGLSMALSRHPFLFDSLFSFRLITTSTYLFYTAFPLFCPTPHSLFLPFSLSLSLSFFTSSQYYIAHTTTRASPPLPLVPNLIDQIVAVQIPGPHHDLDPGTENESFKGSFLFWCAHPSVRFVYP